MAKDFFGNGTGTLTPSDTAGRVPDANAQPIRPTLPEMPTRPGTPARRAEGIAIPVQPTRKPAQSKLEGGANAAGLNPNGLNKAALSLDVRERSKFDRPEDDEVAGSKGFRLPDVMKTVSFSRRLWFAVSFLAPVILTALYMLLIAPSQYITEYRFSVRVPVGQAGSMASSGASLSALFGGNPTPGTDLLDNYTVADYVTSAQAARDIDAKVSLQTAFNKPFDPFSKIGNKPSAERMAKYWQSMVYSSYDVASGLAVVRVKAYTAEDSYAIATNLLGLSSDLVNSIGTHSQQDSVRFAQQQLDRANAQVATLRGELANVRRTSNTVDPTDDPVAKGIAVGNVALVNSLLYRRAQLQAQLETIMQQLHNANAPQVVLLKQQIAATNQQVAQAQQVAGSGTGPNMAITVGRFEEVEAKLKNALAVQAAANSAMSNVQASADAQRLYLTTYVKPALPESPQGPNRWLNLLLVTMIAAMVWIVGRLIGNSIMEHA